MVYDHVKWKPLASGVVNDGAGGNRLASVFQKGSVLRRVASAVDGELIMSDGTFDLDTIAGGGLRGSGRRPRYDLPKRRFADHRSYGGECRLQGRGADLRHEQPGRLGFTRIASKTGTPHRMTVWGFVIPAHVLQSLRNERDQSLE
jgi:hypothetical protein